MSEPSSATPGGQPPEPATDAPLVAWEAPPPPYVPPPSGAAFDGGYAGGPPPFTTGGLLSDTFAIYGADPIRFFVIAAVTSALSFLSSLTSTPFGASATPSDGTAGLVGLLSLVVGIIAGSTMLALAEGGPAMPFGRVLRRGVERAGWLFLTSLLLGLGFFVVFIIPAIVLVLIAIMSPALAAILGVAIVLAIIWLALRLALAIPANVVDNLNSIDALKVSWRATRPLGVWGRIIAASLLLGLLFLPAGIGFGLMLFVAIVGGQVWLAVLAAAFAALISPLSALLTYAAYRRLVAPIQPSWTGPLPVPSVAAAPPPPPVPDTEPAPDTEPTSDAAPPADADPPMAPATPARPVFAPRPFGTVAKALLALVVALDVGGIIAGGYAIGELVAGRIDLPFPTTPGAPFPGLPGLDGEVLPGTVAFGTSSDLDRCTVDEQGVLFSSSQGIVWMAALRSRVTSADEVFLRVSRDGRDLETTLQDRGTYDCLGVEEPIELDPGFYEFEVIVNGTIQASGGAIVQ